MVKLVAGGIAAVVIVAIAAVAAWWFFVREDAELATAPPEIPDQLAQSTATAPSAGATTTASGSAGGVEYRVVAASSEAAYFADEELASIGVPSTAKGATNAITGSFFLTADSWQLDTTQTSTFSVDLTTLNSDQDRRDNRVQEALETGTFPTATFTVERISAVDSTLPPEQEQSFTMTGTLDLHGVEKEITWEVEARREGNVITALATTNFLYVDFGITPPNIGGFVSVEDDVTLQMQIIAQAA
jgi:polyisoprenoid-binding protein YceI